MNDDHLGQGVLGTFNRKEADLASSYHHLLQSDRDLARSTHEAMLRAHRERDIIFQGRLICNVLRPRFISDDRVNELSRVSSILAAIFERAGDFLLSSDSMLDLVFASEEERRIWEIDPGFPGFTHTSRLDAFMVGEEPRFVEYNAESPAGIGYTDCLSEVFLQLPAMRKWHLIDRADRFDGRQQLLDTMLWAHQQWGGSDTPTMAIIDWEDVMTARDFELCADVFRAQGVPTVICDPRRLEYRHGTLWLGEDKISIVYRRCLLHELLDHAAEAQALLQAYRDGAVCMVNTPRSKMLHKKSVMALLSDHAFGLELNEEELDVVDRTVPWTRLLIESTTSFHGETVKLAKLLLDQRERFVLKPVDDYGGRGVVLGWETTPEDWARAIEASMGAPYVVQERVDQPQAKFPMWQDDDLVIEPMLLDTNPLLFRGQMGSILTRISGSALLNVSAGTGSTTPTFVVKDEENE